uniref:Uncharacterized protein n=1 Tax=Clastoptera arizonana TaxID=38151 RepID=A0A1B6BZC0_9HEMI
MNLTITEMNNTYAFKIYRKPTTTDTKIHNSINQPRQHKNAAHPSTLHRPNNIPKTHTDKAIKLNPFNTWLKKMVIYIHSSITYTPKFIAKIKSHSLSADSHPTMTKTQQIYQHIAPQQYPPHHSHISKKTEL